MEGFSQKVRLGLRFAPGFSYSRINEDLDSLSLKSRGTGIRFFVGPEINFVLGENYVFTTGIWYNTKRTSIRVLDSAYANLSEVYNLQYIQIPVTLKLYTNDIAVDTKLYFQLGATFDTRIQDKQLKVSNPTNQLINNFSRFDASSLLGAGIQLQMGQNTYVSGGISYMRGLLNPGNLTPAYYKGIDANGVPILIDFSKTGVQIKNDLIALDLGIRF